jgi:hypothetical protein
MNDQNDQTAAGRKVERKPATPKKQVRPVKKSNRECFEKSNEGDDNDDGSQHPCLSNSSSTDKEIESTVICVISVTGSRSAGSPKRAARFGYSPWLEKGRTHRSGFFE